MKELGIVALAILLTICVGYIMYRFWKAVLVVAIVLILIFGINAYEEHMYNDGICPGCGVELEAIGVANNGQVIWYCEGCHYKCYYK